MMQFEYIGDAEPQSNFSLKVCHMMINKVCIQDNINAHLGSWASVAKHPRLQFSS